MCDYTYCRETTNDALTFKSGAVAHVACIVRSWHADMYGAGHRIGFEAEHYEGMTFAGIVATMTDATLTTWSEEAREDFLFRVMANGL